MVNGVTCEFRISELLSMCQEPLQVITILVAA